MNELLYKIKDVGNVEDYRTAMTHESYVKKYISTNPNVYVRVMREINDVN